MLAGSPVSPEVYAWFYRNVKRDLWLHVGSRRHRRVRRVHRRVADAADLRGRAPAPQPRRRRVRVQRRRARPSSNEVGEMVITRPMPSMPVKFWGDDENMTRYKATYFDEWPGVWRQGDFFKVTARGGTLRARPFRRDAEPLRGADRHRRDLQRPGGHPRGRRRDRGQPRPAGRAVLHADVRQAGRRADARRRDRRARSRRGCAASTRRGTSPTSSSRCPRSPRR